MNHFAQYAVHQVSVASDRQIYYLDTLSGLAGHRIEL